jgi:microcystin-dependent protein
MADVFVGEIKMGGWNFAPFGYALCAGQLMPISQNTALFSLLGTFYGGNGTSNFALPDLQGRAIMGMSNNDPIGEAAGSEIATVTLQSYPLHNHAFNVNSAAAGLGQGLNNFLASTTPAAPSTAQIYAAPGSVQALNSTNSPPALGPSQGGSLPHQNMQPFLTMNYVIALQGIFPTRS